MRTQQSRALGFESLETRTVMNASDIVAADLRTIREMQQNISDDAAAITTAQTIVNDMDIACSNDNAIIVKDMKTLNSDSALRDADYAKLSTLHPWQVSYWQTWTRYQADCATVATDRTWLQHDEAVLSAAENQYAVDLNTLHVAEAVNVQDVSALTTETQILSQDIRRVITDPSIPALDPTQNNQPQSLTLEPGGSFMETFTVTVNSLINLSLLHDLTNPLNNRSAQLTLLNTQTGAIVAQSAHAGMSGNTISCELMPGSYCFVITTDAAIPTIGSSPLPTVLQWTADIEPVSMQTITGCVSIDDNPHAFDISMTSVSFVDGNRVDAEIDPSKPVWLVIHGREDNAFSGKFDDLERELCAAGFQVIACDWSGPAADNMPQLIGLEGENWISFVGAEFRSLLSAWNITGANVNIAAHSWGTFVGYEIAKQYQKENGEGVQAFVALDPAVDPPMTGYDATRVNFAAVSNASWAFHSSIFGSDPEALTANDTFEINADAINPVDAHGVAVTTFASLIRMQLTNDNNPIVAAFVLAQLQRCDVDSLSHTQPDGVLQVTTHTEINPDNASDTYVDADVQTFLLE